MVGDWILDYLEELLLRVCGADRKPVEELDHETGETLEGTRDSYRRAHFDENASRGVDVNLELPSLVDWRVK